MTTGTSPLPILAQTPLHANHVGRGAKMTPFGGWDMPLQYTKVVEEHQAVRQAAGLFDVSHMGLVVVNTPNLQALNYLVPQDLEKLTPAKAVYTQFLNEAGGILDDLIIYQLPAFHAFPEFSSGYLVICNASNTPGDMAWMRQHLPPEATVTLLAKQYSFLALQGPRFRDVLGTLVCTPETLPKRFHLSEHTLTLPGGKAVSVLLSRTGYTGEDGVEIIISNADVNALWDGILAAGSTFGVVPVGLAARDTLRLEAAYPLHGHDIGPNDSPLEAGLGWSVKLEQPGEFIGKAVLHQQKQEGLQKQFYCFELLQKTIARQHDAILLQGDVIGEVTSGSISPCLNKPIAMGYTKPKLAVGDLVHMSIRGKTVEARVVSRPFYKPDYKVGEG